VVVTNAACRLRISAFFSGTENIFHYFLVFSPVLHEQCGWLPGLGAGKAPLLRANRIPTFLMNALLKNRKASTLLLVLFRVMVGVADGELGCSITRLPGCWAVLGAPWRGFWAGVEVPARGLADSQRAGGVTCFVLSFQPLMVNTSLTSL